MQPADIDAINAALRTEPLKWQALVHLLMITGARRGEVLGLKWEDVDSAPLAGVHLPQYLIHPRQGRL